MDGLRHLVSSRYMYVRSIEPHGIGYLVGSELLSASCAQNSKLCQCQGHSLGGGSTFGAELSAHFPYRENSLFPHVRYLRSMMN